MPVSVLTCKSFVRVVHRGERLIERPRSWFPLKFPSGSLERKGEHLIDQVVVRCRAMDDVTGDVSRLGTSTNCERARLLPLLPWLSVACEHWLFPVSCLKFELTFYVGYHLVSSAGDAESTERPVRVPHRGLTQIS